MTHFHFNKDVENNEKITRQLLKLYYIRILYLFIYLFIDLFNIPFKAPYVKCKVYMKQWVFKSNIKPGISYSYVISMVTCV